MATRDITFNITGIPPYRNITDLTFVVKNYVNDEKYEKTRLMHEVHAGIGNAYNAKCMGSGICLTNWIPFYKHLADNKTQWNVTCNEKNCGSFRNNLVHMKDIILDRAENTAKNAELATRGGRKTKCTHTITSIKVFTPNGPRNVHVGVRGGKYVKLDGKFVALSKIPKFAAQKH